jgi:hypothetical protein
LRISRTTLKKERKISLTEEQLEEWVAALRSGKYKQGIGRLKHKITGEYCCLGVYAELNDLFSETDSIYGEITWRNNEVFKAFLPSKVISWDIQALLGRLNDSGEPFENIAAVIEAKKSALVENPVTSRGEE